MFALCRPDHPRMPLTWHLLCLLGLLPLGLLTLTSAFALAAPHEQDGVLLGGWAGGLAPLLPLGGSLLLLLAGWLRLGPARLLATLVLSTLAGTAVMHAWQLPAWASQPIASDPALSVALLFGCCIAGLWLLPAAPLRARRYA